MVARFLKRAINIVCEPVLQAHDSQIVIITTWLLLLQSASSIKLHSSKSLMALLVVTYKKNEAFRGLICDGMCHFSREHSCGNCSFKRFQCPFVKSQTSGMFEMQTGSILSLSRFSMVASMPLYGFVSPIKPSHFSEFPLSLSEIVPLKFLSKSVTNGFCRFIGR